MNSTILICLAAVVVLIVIIAFAALRFLRADDSDPFEEVAEEPRRQRRVHEPAELREPVTAAAARPSRPRSADDMSWPGERTDRPSPRPVADHGAERGSGYRERAMDRPAGPDRTPAPERRARQGRPAPAGSGRPAPAGAARPKSARPAAAAAQDKKWDTMSDVDYWAELASEKPLADSAPASPGPASSPSGRRSEPSADSRPGRGDATVQLPVRQPAPRPAAASNGRSRNSRPGNGRPADFGQQPADSRPAHAPGRYAASNNEPATQSLAALARLGTHPQAVQPAPAVKAPRPAARPATPAPLDDDPLTSPSFPAINTSDSRSYRSGRSDSQPRNGHRRPDYQEPAQQYPSYPAADPRATSAPNGYPTIQPPAAPSGNPYGSFVSQPAASYQPQASAPEAQPEVSYGGYPAGGQVQHGGNWHSAPMPAGQPVNGYDQHGHPASYPAGHEAAYQQQAHPAVQYDQRGYASQDAAYGVDYQGYPSYGTNGY